MAVQYFAPLLSLAPMAGVTDAPFRRLCRRLGADLAVSEMITADPRLSSRAKSRVRANFADEPHPRGVQLVGADSRQLAEAARYYADQGADLIDINMGCPAKKVCRVAAGSALLADESLVARILEEVVAAANVPVTLKIRTGPDPSRRNGVSIARIAEASGICALAVHGRTRACAFKGEAEYHTIAQIKCAVSIPVIANGDIDTPAKARAVLDATAADGIMIGRAAQGNPWIFQDIRQYLSTGTIPVRRSWEEVEQLLLEHVAGLHALYGGEHGVLVARKHLAWYCKSQPGGGAFWSRVNKVTDCKRQLRLISEHFRALNYSEDLAA